MTALIVIACCLAYAAVGIWWGRLVTIQNVDYSIHYYMDRYPRLYGTVPEAAEAADRAGSAALGYSAGLIWPISLPGITLFLAARWLADRLGHGTMHLTPTEKAWNREQDLKRREAELQQTINRLPAADREWIQKNGMDIR